MQPRVVCHDGACYQCTGEGTVITIDADPLPLSVCPACLALIISNASGIRRAIRERWLAMNRRLSETRSELQRKARANLERVATQGDGNGRDG